MEKDLQTTKDLVNANAAEYPDTPFLNFYEFVRDIQDICGGILVTQPTYQDWEHTDLKPYLERYMGGAGDYSA